MHSKYNDRHNGLPFHLIGIIGIYTFSYIFLTKFFKNVICRYISNTNNKTEGFHYDKEKLVDHQRIIAVLYVALNDENSLYFLKITSYPMQKKRRTLN